MKTRTIAADAGQRHRQAVVRRAWLDLDRVRLYSATLLVLFCIFLAVWGYLSDGFSDRSFPRPGADFSAFWAASYVALHEGAASVYDVATLSRVIAEHGALPEGAPFFLPWLYPPTFLVAVLPLSLLPFGISYVLFMASTIAVYVVAVTRLLGPDANRRYQAWLPVLASPAVLIGMLIGQNSMLTAGLAAFAMGALGKRPVLAGVCIGLLAIKPQLALLFPFVLLASRAWTAFIAAAATATLFTVGSFWVCGWETLPAFFESTQIARERVIENGGIAWYGMPSTIAAARLAGASVEQAYLAHALVAGSGVGAMIYVWRRTAVRGLRIASLAIATMLVTPYLHGYELSWLGVAGAGIVSDGARMRLGGTERLVLLTAWLLPLYEITNALFKLPQIGPLVLTAVMSLILRRAAGTRELRQC